MMNKILTISKRGILLMITVLIAGCGSSKSTSENGIPGWVVNPDDYYSEQQYLMAVGSGSTLNEARSDAFSSLSQIFKMDVDATEILNSESIDQQINGEIFSESTSELLNNIRIGTNQELMNTTILVSEMDDYGTYHALAGMDRMETGRIYSSEISSNDLKLLDFEEQADNENNTLQKLILLKKAKTLAELNEVLTQQLNIIRSGTASLDMASQKVSRINEKFRKVQESANVYLRSENVSDMVQAAITGVFQKNGFSLTENRQNAILEANVNYNRAAANLNRDDAEFVKWELIIEINDLQSNRSFQTYSAEGRDGAPSYNDALKRADFTARKKIESEFNTFLNKELLANN